MMVNLTPHIVTIETLQQRVHIPKSGLVARLVDGWRPLGTLAADPNNAEMGTSIDVVQVVTGEVSELPATATGVYYIVSRVIAEAFRDRSDLLFPVDLVRDEGGSIVGCRRLGTFASSLAAD